MLNNISQIEKVIHMISLMWDIKLKATNEQTRKTNKYKLIETGNCFVVTREKGMGLGKG